MYWLSVLELLAISFLMYLIEHGEYEYRISYYTNKQLTFLGGLYHETSLLPVWKKVVGILLAPIVLIILLVYYLLGKEIHND